jgi:hypothetical protein
MEQNTDWICYFFCYFLLHEVVMGRHYRLSWDAIHHQWRKRVNGQPFRVTCGELGLPRERWTKEQSYQAANEWLDNQLLGTKPILDRIADDAGGLEALAANLVKGQASAELLSFIAKGNQESSELTTEIMQAMARAINPLVPHNATVSASIDAFLDTLRSKGMKAKTYKEIQITMDTLKEWWGPTPIAELDEKRVADAYKRIANMNVNQNTKHKRWGFFKRWAKFVWSMGVIEMPRNLESPLFRFKQQAKAIKTFPIEVVRQSLKDLPEKLRCWALLGLNCGMTNIDIAELRHDMVADGYLTRKRIKTEAVTNVPMVKYRLWKETLAVLMKLKSNHPDLWFVSGSNTILVQNRMEGEKSKEYDLIGSAWKHNNKKKKCPIPISKFRNVASTLLEEHETYGRYGDYFGARSANGKG